MPKTPRLTGLSGDPERAMDLYVGSQPATPEQLRHMRLTVCDHATDAADARALFELLGLIEPRTPSLTHGQRKELMARRRRDAALEADRAGRRVETVRPDTEVL